MFRRSYKKCCCMNNSSYTTTNNNIIEDTCNNICSHNFDELDTNECDCGFDEDYEIGVFPDNPMLAQSYVPWQFMDKTFKPCVGLKMGTLFPELVSPYMPCQSMRVNEYLASTNTVGKGCNSNNG